MPSPEETGRKQTAVLWESSGFDAYGQPKVISPVEISVRWEETRIEAVTAQGNPVNLTASVRVNQDVPIGSVMMLGTLDDLAGTGAITGLMEVVNRIHVPDIKGRKTSRVLQLAKYKDTLPTIAT